MAIDQIWITGYELANETVSLKTVIIGNSSYFVAEETLKPSLHIDEAISVDLKRNIFLSTSSVLHCKC
jgi:hypothetical protein